MLEDSPGEGFKATGDLGDAFRDDIVTSMTFNCDGNNDDDIAAMAIDNDNGGRG